MNEIIKNVTRLVQADISDDQLKAQMTVAAGLLKQAVKKVKENPDQAARAWVDGAEAFLRKRQVQQQQKAGVQWLCGCGQRNPVGQKECTACQMWCGTNPPQQIRVTDSFDNSEPEGADESYLPQTFTINTVQQQQLLQQLARDSEAAPLHAQFSKLDMSSGVAEFALTIDEGKALSRFAAEASDAVKPLLQQIRVAVLTEEGERISRKTQDDTNKSSDSTPQSDQDIIADVAQQMRPVVDALSEQAKKILINKSSNSTVKHSAPADLNEPSATGDSPQSNQPTPLAEVVFEQAKPVLQNLLKEGVEAINRKRV